MKKYQVADFGEMESMFRRNFFNSLTGFKSLYLIGSINSEKMPNLAPFSQVFHVGANPALLGVLFRPMSADSHTLKNILQNRFFTCNQVTPAFFRQAHQSSARYPVHVSEFEAVGLQAVFHEDWAVPYVGEAKIKMALELAQVVELINGTQLVVGKILEVLLPQEIIGQDGFLDLEKAQTVTCSGLDSYHLTQVLERLPYAKAKS